jgi:hypothetical protein
MTMKTNDDTFVRYEDEVGETYFCPMDTVKAERVVSELPLDDCVEASTAGRYSGNLNVIDRFTS